jgi:mono/diheme cytochrome c family protein
LEFDPVKLCGSLCAASQGGQYPIIGRVQVTRNPAKQDLYRLLINSRHTGEPGVFADVAREGVKGVEPGKRRNMKFMIALVLSCSAIAAVLAFTLGSNSPTSAESPGVARGRYLVTVSACSDCHTPLKMGASGPEPDLTRFLSGHPETANVLPAPDLGNGPWFAATAGMTAWSGPWGISYSANLTPDRNTGLGIWTEKIFVNTMRTGKHYGVARDILPPMPWQSIAALTDDDLKSVFAYLKSIPAIKNRVPDPVPAGGGGSFE